MAKLNSNLWIPSGSFRDMVFCNGKTRKPYIRAKPDKQKERSPAQVLNSLKLQTMERFLFPFKGLINEVWKDTMKKAPYDCARSWFYHHSLIACNDTVEILYQEVKLSQGNLAAPEILKSRLEGTVLHLEWEAKRTRTATDFSSLFLGIHNQTTEASMHTETTALKKDERLSLILPEGFLKGTLHAYIIFLSPDRKNASPTRYIKLN
ncbi:DUF6266 family protein [Desertivirga brevis]|uniref:DUF6266 family protein n=1 Tax=Desertivirga brevis TaxID=2810310 RepID=UPI001A960426|nr:DUF6266 family protein [Pedobacter sp. SYSU D00873]